MSAPVLLLTHRGDYFTIDRVAEAVAARGRRPLRVDTDLYPAHARLSLDFPASGKAKPEAWLRVGDEEVALHEVRAFWARRLWPGALPADLDPRFAPHCRREARTAFFDTLQLFDDAYWMNPIAEMRAGESKIQQLKVARELGLEVPPTSIGNDPGRARAFYHEQDGQVVTKLLGALSQTMNATGDFMYTSRVTPAHLAALDELRYAPQIFQPEVEKACELRVIVVEDRVFAAAVDTSRTARGQIDWRQTEPGADVRWTRYELPREVEDQTLALVERFGLRYGAVDFIVEPDGRHVFLEINPAGEWGWLERDLGLPISAAIADALVAACPPSRVKRPRSRKVLIITKTDDNQSIGMVSEELRKRGAEAIRLDSDRFPDLVQVSCEYGAGDEPHRTVRTPAGVYGVDDLEAVWYRRYHAGAALPLSLGDTRPASVQESRRVLFGFIGALPCFHLDPIESVRRCDHKELQIRRAAELGLDVPKTLYSNQPDDVRAFYERCSGEVITKMQCSFAIYRQGVENVVFTNKVNEADLVDLSGLKYCPMTFQEHLPKRLELRTTIVGRKVMTAAVDSQKTEKTSLDWRKDGIGLLDQWFPYQLPRETEGALLQLLSELGLNYGAIDFVVTPDDRLVFLEVNAVGEFFWLQRTPGLPIVENIADVLLGEKERIPVDAEAWANFVPR